MTDRQLQAYDLISRGLTQKEVSQIMGIRRESVKRLLREGRDRYNLPAIEPAVVQLMREGRLH